LVRVGMKKSVHGKRPNQVPRTRLKIYILSLFVTQSLEHNRSLCFQIGLFDPTELRQGQPYFVDFLIFISNIIICFHFQLLLLF
jgi:hypothetical protein